MAFAPALTATSTGAITVTATVPGVSSGVTYRLTSVR
jgi:hypothetical protein